MSDGTNTAIEEQVNEVIPAPTVEQLPVIELPVERLQESQEEIESPTEEGTEVTVNCIQIDISERDALVQNGEPSSAVSTPLERSQEVAPQDTLSPQGSQSEQVLVLKEWNSFINLLARIPVKAQRGLNTFDLKLTCVSTISEEILVLGTNVGVVYWYNRKTDMLDRLRCEGLHPVTVLSCINTVDYMVAAGNQEGIVTIFQIPRDPSTDKVSSTSPEAYYERKTKKSRRFLVQDLHKGAVTSLEWSSNGMKLFSGDQSGHVVLTDIDYDLVQIRSSVLLCENHEIVQLSYARKHLLICSTFRSIIYSLESKGFKKVGTQDRKVTGKFGGLIVSSAWEESPKVYNVRPSARLWVADLDGVVQHTIKFKELILSGSQSEIHVIKPYRSSTSRLLSPPQPQSQDNVQFTRLFRFMKDYLVTYHNDILHVIDARNTVVLGICKELRSVLDVAVSKEEIFILESSRNVIRLSAKPDKFSTLTSSNFFSNFNNYFSSPTSNLVSSSSSTMMNGEASPINGGVHHKHGSSSGNMLPDIMSASIADFRFPQEPINFLTSKLKETSEKVIPKINPLLNTIKTVIEADVDIEDGQKLLEVGGMPLPVMIPSEGGVTEIAGFDIFMSPPPIPPEEPVFVVEPERFKKITNLPFEDVVVEIKPKARKGKKDRKRETGSSSARSSAPPSEAASDSVSVSSAFSNTSGSENNPGTSSASASGGRKGSGKSDVTLSSSNSGSEAGVMSVSEHPCMHAKDQLGVPLALSQSWSVGCPALPSQVLPVTTEELHIKEEMLARRLKWPWLLPASVSPDVLLDDPSDPSPLLSKDVSPDENTYWQMHLSRNGMNRPDRSSVLTLVGPQQDGATGDDTDTDSRTLSMENASFGTVIDREVLRTGDTTDNQGESSQKTSRSSSLKEDDEDDDVDKYYTDIYTRYRSKDSHSVSSFSSVLSFGPPSGSSHVSGGTAGGYGSYANHLNANGSLCSSIIPESSAVSVQEEELTNSKEKSSDTVTSSSSTTEEADSIVESKIVFDEYWRKWRLPGANMVQLVVCDKFLICLSCRGTVYYSTFDSLTLHWKSTNYSASFMAVSPCGSVIWRIYRGDLFSLTNPSQDPVGPFGTAGGGEQWSKLTQKKDVISATVQRTFGWIVRSDGGLEFCTGLYESRLVPYFEKVYAPWPIQDLTCIGHRLWALTSDGRVVFRTGTSHLNPKGIDWLELRWSGTNDISEVCSISGGDVRVEDGVTSIWFSDTSGNLYFTTEERDAKGGWIPWKVAVSNCIVTPSQSTPQPCKLVLLSSLKEQVSKSLKSLVLATQKNGLKLCSSKTSIWFSATGTSLLYGNRSTVTGHYWKPLRIDQGISVPSTWTRIYANSIYNGHGNLWIIDSRGYLFYLPPSGGKIQPLDLPMFTDGPLLLEIAPAPEALWALTSSGDIYGRCDITSMNSVGKSWRQVHLSMLSSSTQFVHISCGSEVAWAVDDRGEVYMRTGNLRPPGAQDMSPAWNRVEISACCKGVFTKVYVGASGNMVWALDNKKRIYARQAVFPDYPIGTGWLMVKGVEAQMLAISDSAVWALATNGTIYRRHGITKTNFVGDYWRKIPGNASAIAVSLCDELWALTAEGHLLKHSKKVMQLRGWDAESWEEHAALSPSGKMVLDEEDEDWELVDNSEI